MRTCVKKLIAVLLTASFAVALGLPAFAGLDGNYSAPIPTVYLQGQGSTLYADKDDTNSGFIHDVEIPDGYIGDRAKEMIGPLLKGLTRSDWDEWADMLVDAVAALYEKQALDENGEASNGSGIYTSSGKYNRVNADGTYLIGAYTPNYDWRLDPCLIADEIHTYIEQVKSATHAQKVNLMGRSIGASVLLAYLEKYGMEDIDTAVLYCPSFYGMEVFSRAFAGKIRVDAAAAQRFADYYIATGKLDDALGDEFADVAPLLTDMLSYAASSYSLNLTADVLNRVYRQVYEKVYPRLLVKMYGSMPSFWSLVGDEDYEDAKALIFGGQEDKYAKLIEKTDNFHYNVLNRSGEIITDLVNAGNKIQIVTKYGVPMLPVAEDASQPGDMLTTLYSASMGATCAPVGETLSAEYRMAASRKGLWKYFSPELDVDASTGILPDHTWNIKNIDHRNMPECINALFEAILNYDGYMTVFDDPDFPQYLDYNGEAQTVTPLKAAADEEQPQQSRIQAFFARIRNFFNAIRSLLARLFRRDANA